MRKIMLPPFIYRAFRPISLNVKKLPVVMTESRLFISLPMGEALSPLQPPPIGEAFYLPPYWGGPGWGLQRTKSHTTRGRNGRQECRERGYYHLHRNLNQSCFFHNCQLSIVLVETSPPPYWGGKGWGSFFILHSSFFILHFTAVECSSLPCRHQSSPELP